MSNVHTNIPPHGQREYMNDGYYEQFVAPSRFVQLYPGDTHAKWGEVIDAWAAGIKIMITRVKNNLSCSGASYEVGSVHFIPMSKVSIKYVTEEEASHVSIVSYAQDKNLTWEEWLARATHKEA